MWVLLVTALFMFAGEQQTFMGKYNVTKWDTKAECEAFFESPEGQSSIAGLRAAIAAQTGDTNPTITHECFQEGN